MRNNCFLFLFISLVSELRVVLLGNSGTETCSVLNLILGVTGSLKKLPSSQFSQLFTISEYTPELGEKNIAIINIPHLLQPNITPEELTKHVEHSVRLLDPGPHVILLVLQPEDFTEEQKERLCSVLQLYGDHYFQHSLVLISTPREGIKYNEYLPLMDMIQKCRYRHLNLQNLQRTELLNNLGQTMKENSGKHLSCEVFADTTTTTLTAPYKAQRPITGADPAASE